MNSSSRAEIAFQVPGEPASKARARFTGQGSKVRAYTPERTKEAERKMAAAYLAVAGRINKADNVTAFSIEAEFHLARNQRRDVDNMLKLVLDGLNEVAWGDDSQVVEVIGRKIYHSDEARTLVWVREVGKIPRSESSCENCGAIFPRPPSHAAKKYCSASCRGEALAAKRKRTCPQCLTKFVAGSHGGTWCSAACAQASKHVDATCVRCAKNFTKPRHMNRSGNSYCSPECKDGFWRDQRKGAAAGTCEDCGGPTSKRSYRRCRDCQFASGGTWSRGKHCSACGTRLRNKSACAAHPEAEPYYENEPDVVPYQEDAS